MNDRQREVTERATGRSGPGARPCRPRPSHRLNKWNQSTQAHCRTPNTHQSQTGGYVSGLREHKLLDKEPQNRRPTQPIHAHIPHHATPHIYRSPPPESNTQSTPTFPDPASAIAAVPVNRTTPVQVVGTLWCFLHVLLRLALGSLSFSPPPRLPPFQQFDLNS